MARIARAVATVVLVIASLRYRMPSHLDANILRLPSFCLGSSSYSTSGRSERRLTACVRFSRKSSRRSELFIRAGILTGSPSMPGAVRRPN